MSMRMRLDAVASGGEGSGWWGEWSMISKDAMTPSRNRKRLELSGTEEIDKTYYGLRMSIMSQEASKVRDVLCIMKEYAGRSRKLVSTYD